jgi:hypothetical protein
MRPRTVAIALSLVLLAVVTAIAQTPASLSPYPKQQYFYDNGDPCAGCKLYSYQAGTSSPAATYTDSTGVFRGTNPVVLDAAGRASIWLSNGTFYKLVLKGADNALIWTVDGVSTGAYINPRYRGAWAVGTAYLGGDVVSYGSPAHAYLAIAASTGVVPTDGTKWAIFQGPAGPNCDPANTGTCVLDDVQASSLSVGTINYVIRDASLFTGSDPSLKITAAITSAKSYCATIPGSCTIEIHAENLANDATPWSVDPFSSLGTSRGKLVLGNGVYLTNIPIVVCGAGNAVGGQNLTGVGFGSVIKAGTSFPINSAVVTISHGQGSGGSYAGDYDCKVRDVEINANNTAGSIAAESNLSMEGSEFRNVKLTFFKKRGYLQTGTGSQNTRFGPAWILCNDCDSDAIPLYIDSSNIGGKHVVQDITVDGKSQVTACIQSDATRAIAFRDIHVENCTDGIKQTSVFGQMVVEDATGNAGVTNLIHAVQGNFVALAATPAGASCAIQDDTEDSARCTSVGNTISYSTGLIAGLFMADTGGTYLTPATSSSSSLNVGSPYSRWRGYYNNGSTDNNVDQWDAHSVLGAGTNPSSMLSWGHSGPTGVTRWGWQSGTILKPPTLHSASLSDAMNTGYDQRSHVDLTCWRNAADSNNVCLGPRSTDDALIYDGKILSGNDPSRVVINDDFPPGNATGGSVGELNWQIRVATACTGAYIASALPNLGIIGLTTGAAAGNGCKLSLDAGNINLLGGIGAHGDVEQQFIFKLPQTTDSSFRIGYAPAASTPVVEPAAGVWLRYDKNSACGGCGGAADTTFKFETRKASSSDVYDTTISPNTASFYRLQLRNIASGKVGLTLYDGTGASIVAEKTFCASGCDVTSSNVDTTTAMTPSVTIYSATGGGGAAVSAQVDYYSLDAVGLSR